ncbi:DmsE family decaheme c-type cytochrome [Alteromonadaceae bacterium 2753L.S.0a.02]|nr:DmsE family decaheme c-type cytochrome [Alteromonadaceae bacterium 2753L.S.0a.02]
MRLCFPFLALVALCWCCSAFAEDSDEEKRAELPAAVLNSIGGVEYTRKGADTCIKCHDESAEYPVFDIFKTKHAVIADSRTPFSGLQCEACHGPGVKAIQFMEQALETGSHVGRVRPGEKRPPIFNFGPKSNESVQAQNGMCLECHEDDAHIAWQGSAHQMAEIACADCHTVHTAHDPSLDKHTQSDVCYNCHQQQRADFLKPSHHPVRFGELGCSDCHAAHGSTSDSMLAKNTLNETCFGCHAEKRGPFLWEHAPVAEDCSLCHEPHGSVHQALLSKRAPLLCRDCHSQEGHPSLANSPGGQPTAMLLGNSCTNCHSQVHGSNHPSGLKMMR